MKLLLIDNYDSFVYNLVQYFAELGVRLDRELVVIRNDEWTLEQIDKYQPSACVISPGPGTPDDAGICLELVKKYWNQLPIFGVCLGLQVIVQAMGGKIVRANTVMHGKTSAIEHDGKGVFAQLESPLRMTRYHSLIASQDSMPTSLEVSARSVGSDEIMAVRAKSHPMVEAVQFHPESILSVHGISILQNFIQAVKG